MIILASGSPRRKELLRRRGIDFDVIVTDADENIDGACPPNECVNVIAKRKAEAAVRICAERGISDANIVAADTVVYTHREILGKPKDRDDAFRMLKLLNGIWHDVHTGVCVAFLCGEQVKYASEQCLTKVKFRSLTDEEIFKYIGTEEPFGKAGSYAIQGVGRDLIERIDGDYENVVGLPTGLLFRMLGFTT